MTPEPNPHAGWDLPFEEQPTSPLADADQVVMCGSIVVLGAVIPSPLGRFPALVWRFETASRQMLPPIALVLDEQRMAGVPSLVEAAATAAIRRARS